MLVVACVAGCTKPQLDTSSDRDFRLSLAEVKAKLPADARAELDSALALLKEAYPTGPTNGGSAGSLSPRLSAMLQGKTGRQVIAVAAELQAEREARRMKAEALARERTRRQALRELRELREELDSFDLETLEQVRIEDARLILPVVRATPRKRTNVVRDWFRTDAPAAVKEQPDASELPSIEIRLESTLRSGIYAVLFDVQLVTIDGIEPWLSFQTRQRFIHGLFYGQDATRRFVPEEFFEAFGSGQTRRTPDPDSLVLVVRPVRLYDADGKAFAGADLNDAELARVKVLLDTLAQTSGAATGDARAGSTPARSNAATSPSADAALAAQVDAIDRRRKTALAQAFRAKVRAIRFEQALAEEAREPFDRFLVEAPRLRWSDSKVHRKPVINFRVRNETGEPISRCHCRGILTSPERDRPWVDAPFVHRFRDDLPPGETRNVRIVPNWLGPWGGAPKDRDDLTLDIAVNRLYGTDRTELFVYDFPEQSLERLRDLEALIAEKGW